MTTDQIERRARRLHSDAVAAEGGIGLAREELSVVPHADIDQTGRLVLGAAARAVSAETAPTVSSVSFLTPSTFLLTSLA